MFKSTFRNTSKSILRSVTFWLVFAMFVFMVGRYGFNIVSRVKSGAGSVFVDSYTPPEFMTQSGFLSAIDNLVHAGSLMYPLAIFVVIVTVLVVNRDHGDQFFEIEKAANAKPSLYVLGRLSAITAITFVTQWILSFVVLQFIVFGQGGVENMSTLECVFKSFLYLSRTNLCTALPYILFYMGLTYFIGTLFKNGIAAAAGGFLYAIVYFVTFLLYRHSASAFSELYFDYLCPMPNKLRNFIAYVGSENEQQMFAMFGTSTGKALLCIAFLAGVGVLCAIASYLLTRKRES